MLWSPPWSWRDTLVQTQGDLLAWEATPSTLPDQGAVAYHPAPRLAWCAALQGRLCLQGCLAGHLPPAILLGMKMK